MNVLVPFKFVSVDDYIYKISVIRPTKDPYFSKCVFCKLEYEDKCTRNPYCLFLSFLPKMKRAKSDYWVFSHKFSISLFMSSYIKDL